MPGQFSFAEIPLSFSLILGVTGTLEEQSIEQKKIMKDVYNIVSETYSPSVYNIPHEKIDEKDKIDGLPEDNKHEEYKCEIYEGKEKWFEKIAN